MCRYSDHDYPKHFACLTCRVSMKGEFGFGQASVRRCPTCGADMLSMGRDFKAPRKSAVSQWRKIEILVAEGVTFDSCGCGGPGRRPKTLASAKADRVIRHRQTRTHGAKMSSRVRGRRKITASPPFSFSTPHS